jgi:signal peptidase I
MQLIKDIWTWVKEWNEWKMKDWIKAAVIVVIVLFILKVLIIGG